MAGNYQVVFTQFFEGIFSVAVVAASNFLFIVSSQVEKLVNRVQGSKTSKVF
jgi:hypothetical protein